MRDACQEQAHSWGQGSWALRGVMRPEPRVSASLYRVIGMLRRFVDKILGHAVELVVLMSIPARGSVCANAYVQ